MSNRNPWLNDEPTSSRGGFDPNKDYLQEHVQKQQQTLESQQRALRVLTETEQIGADTAVELKRQGEVLNRAEAKVENINENLNVAEYHVRTIKSWFGGLTNKFRKQPAGKTSSNENQATENQEQINQMNLNAEAAGEMVHQSNTKSNVMAARGGNLNLSNNYGSKGGGGSNFNTNSSNKKQSQFDLYENQIDSNLDQMSSGLSRLKDLGMGLKTELDSQNAQLDRVNAKMAKVDERTANVNQVLRRLNN